MMHSRRMMETFLMASGFFAWSEVGKCFIFMCHVLI